MGVRAFIELSGEHPTLPRAEAFAALAAEHVDVRAASFDSYVLRIDAIGPVERAVHRLGLAHVVCEELASGDLDAIRGFARDADLSGRTFRVRSRGVGIDVDTLSLEGHLGADFGRSGRVDLENPAVDYRLLVGEEYLLGRIVHRVDRTRLEATKVARRPFSLPISLHPKFARALLNLSRVPMAGAVLDPFCGTGGILLEAAAIGLRPIGFDRDRKMVLGCRPALRGLVDGGLAVADAGAPPLRAGTVHGVATDPPYGRAASTRGEPIARLYERTFRAFRDLLPTGMHAAVVLPNEAMIDLASTHLERIEAHALRVHRSLVRHFCVFVNS
jgi:tRNA (guanine10-N2)-dimethyltransferase